MKEAGCTHKLQFPYYRGARSPSDGQQPLISPSFGLFLFCCSLPLLHTHTLLRHGRSKFQTQQMHQFNLYRAENLLVLKLLCISIAVCGQVEKEPWSLPPIRDKSSCWYANGAAPDRPAWLG